MTPVEALLSERMAALTPAERRLGTHLARHYPVAALGSMTQLALGAQVSKPTVLRLLKKLGFRGYPDFQAAVRDEVEARLTSPILRHDRWSGGVPDSHILNRFADAVLKNLAATLGRIDHAEFDALADIVSDPARRVFVTGGRITQALAGYLASQLRVMRPGVTLIAGQSGDWPPTLIDLAEGDLLLVFDIRRYEANVLNLVETAAAQGAVVALLTDPWISPVAAHARLRFSAQMEVPSVWDSTVALQVLVETLLAAVQERAWPGTQARMQRLEAMYARAQLFGRRGWPKRSPP